MIMAIVLAFLIVSGSGAQESRPATRPGELTRAQMESDLDLLASAIREKWAYLEDKEKNHGVSLTGLLARARSQLGDVMTKAEFHWVVLELVASLKDGHAAVFTLGVARPQRRWPFRFEETADGIVVVETWSDEVKLGERLHKVHHTTMPGTVGVGSVIEYLERTTIASSASARRSAAIRRLHETDTPLVTVSLARADGSTHLVSCESIDPETRPAPKQEPLWSVESVADGVARIRGRTFTIADWTGWLAAPVEKREEFIADTRAKIDACFKEIGTPKALILDLRGNPGGTDLLGIHLAKHLLSKKFVYYALSAKYDGKWSEPHGYEHDPVPAAERFDGPLAILIDERCFSVTDNLLRAIVENRDDVIVVGRPTNGGTGAPAQIAKLPESETSVTLCTMRVYGPKGSLIEGRGTVPTIPVRWTAADFIEKRDPDLAAALQALRKAESRAGTQQTTASRPASRAGVLDRAAMESDLAFLESAIREKWSYLEDKEKNFGVDLAALVARAKKSLPENGSKGAFHAVVLEIVAGLKDGHAHVFTIGVPEPQRRWPFRVEETPEGFVVVESKDGFKPGEKISVLNVNGVEIEEAVARIERSTIASTPGARRKHAIERLHQTDEPHVLVEYVDPGGWGNAVIPTVDVTAASRSKSEEAPSWRPSVAAPGVARFSVRTFAVEDWTNWLKAAPESREAFLTKTKESIDRCFADLAALPPSDRRALIIDLRGNGGGTDLLAIHLAKHLLPKRFVYFRLAAKRGGSWREPHGYEHDPFPERQRFDGPLAVLIDETCFSTTDNFLRAVIENREDVIVVGRPTNGGTGAPALIAQLPASGTRVTLCTQRVQGPKGTLIEGRGTVPTIPVRWTAADFIENRDPDLAAALQALKKAESRGGR
jgi:C-terminal processing protease CtpA/Prc